MDWILKIFPGGFPNECSKWDVFWTLLSAPHWSFLCLFAMRFRFGPSSSVALNSCTAINWLVASRFTSALFSCLSFASLSIFCSMKTPDVQRGLQAIHTWSPAKTDTLQKLMLEPSLAKGPNTVVGLGLIAGHNQKNTARLTARLYFTCFAHSPPENKKHIWV